MQNGETFSSSVTNYPPTNTIVIDYSCDNTKNVPSFKNSASYYLDGGGTFFCMLLIFIIIILLLVQLLAWRFLDLDILPVDDSISNRELSNSSIHRLNFNDLDWVQTKTAMVERKHEFY